MTIQEINTALLSCGELIKTRSRYLDNPRLYHCTQMITQAVAFDSIGKKNRWLGFIQGVIYSEGIASVSELKETNKSVTQPGEPKGEGEG